MAIMIRSFRFDGFQPNWYHFNCFFNKASIENLDQVEGVYQLRPADQKNLKERIKSGVGTDATGKSTLSMFNIQYAKSGKSKCKKCDSAILKEEVRLSRKAIDPEKSWLGMIDRWHHVGCFLADRHNLGWKSTYDPSMLPGWDFMESDVKTELKGLFKKAALKDGKKDKIKKKTKIDPELKKKEDK